MIYGANDLCGWLKSQEFRIAEDRMRHHDNECNWYAYRRSGIKARQCECNSEKEGMQIVVTPSIFSLNGVRHESAKVDLRGEANGVWWDLSAYGVSFGDVQTRLGEIESALIAAWNAIHPAGN